MTATPTTTNSVKAAQSVPAAQPETQKSEIYAWWIYFVGYEPLSIVALQVLISVILTKYSIAQSINPSKGNAQCQAGETCVLFMLGRLPVSPLSFTYFVSFASIFCQAVVFVLLGALADYGSLRKKLLMGCTVVGSLVTMCFAGAYEPRLLWLAALLSVLISTVYGAALVFYNAYLPLLVNNHPSLSSANANESTAVLEEKSSDKLPQSMSPTTVKLVSKDQLASSISTKGIIAGYSAALLLLILSALMINFVPYKGMAAVAVAVTGLWWLVVGMGALHWFKERPGVPLPPNTFYLTASARTILHALRHVQGLPDTMRFLVAYLFISGGYGTIGYAAVTFATKELGISEQGSLLAVIILLVSSMVGGFTFMFFQRLFKANSLSMTVFLILLESAIPAYGMIGIFSSRMGLRNLWEAYVIAGYHGFLIGAIQSFTRVSFSELVPKGRESECFALYAITERLGSSVGLLMMTVIDVFVKESRWCFVCLLVMLLAPVPLLVRGVNFERGRRNAAASAHQ